MDALYAIAIALLIILGVRVPLVFVWQSRALREAHAFNVADIDTGKRIDVRARYDQIPSFGSQLFDLTLWHYYSPFGDRSRQGG